MMAGYPWIYWLVVLIVAGAVATVLMGIGYLVGRRAAHREAMAGMRDIQAIGNDWLKRGPENHEESTYVEGSTRRL